MSEAEFFARFPTTSTDIYLAIERMLHHGLESRDAGDVEFGLYLGHRFGFPEICAADLIALALQTWHERHEDVVDALKELSAAESAESLYTLATMSLPYRSYDTSNSLGVKCVRALASIDTEESLALVGELAHSAGGPLGAEALAQARRTAADARASVGARAAAGEALRMIEYPQGAYRGATRRRS